MLQTLFYVLSFQAEFYMCKSIGKHEGAVIIGICDVIQIPIFLYRSLTKVVSIGKRCFLQRFLVVIRTSYN